MLRWVLIFHPRKANPFVVHPWKKNKLSVHYQDSPLHGWFFESGENRPLIIYFGGNAEDVSYNFETVPRFPNISILFMTYRGYGDTPGKPSQHKVFTDALATYDYLINVRKIQPSQIFLMGRSIGSSVASYVASQRSAKGLILVTPFDRIMNVANQIWLFKPFAWILRRNFNTLEYMKKAKVNTLVLTARMDEVVPKSSSNNLLNSCPDKISHLEIHSADHQIIHGFDEYYQAINDFVNAPDLIVNPKHGASRTR
jgi:hypothetical protein